MGDHKRRLPAHKNRRHKIRWDKLRGMRQGEHERRVKARQRRKLGLADDG